MKLDGLVIEDGFLSSAGFGGGAGIKIGNGTITTTENSTIKRSTSLKLGGGGIENGSGILFLNNCSLIANTAPDGGAI